MFVSRPFSLLKSSSFQKKVYQRGTTTPEIFWLSWYPILTIGAFRTFSLVLFDTVLSVVHLVIVHTERSKNPIIHKMSANQTAQFTRIEKENTKSHDCRPACLHSPNLKLAD